MRRSKNVWVTSAVFGNIFRASNGGVSNVIKTYRKMAEDRTRA